MFGSRRTQNHSFPFLVTVTWVIFANFPTCCHQVMSSVSANHMWGKWSIDQWEGWKLGTHQPYWTCLPSVPRSQVAWLFCCNPRYLYNFLFLSETRQYRHLKILFCSPRIIQRNDLIWIWITRMRHSKLCNQDFKVAAIPMEKGTREAQQEIKSW